MANSVDPDQTAPIGAVCSGSTLFASIHTLFVSNARQLFAADDYSRRHFQMHFFGALRVHAVCFYTLFVSNARQLFAADDFSRRHFQMHFFLGALRV